MGLLPRQRTLSASSELNACIQSRDTPALYTHCFRKNLWGQSWCVFTVGLLLALAAESHRLSGTPKPKWVSTHYGPVAVSEANSNEQRLSTPHAHGLGTQSLNTPFV